MKHGEDRQVMPRREQIHPGHLARYEFAKSRVSGFVLDAACGVGYGTQMLSETCDVTGVDIHPDAIDYARTHYFGPTYKLADIEKTKPDKYDWVVSFETVEHLEYPELALCGFRTSEKLIISTPNELQFPFKPEDHQGQYPHKRHYTPKQFESLLNTTGWTVKEKLGQKTKVSPVTRCEGMFLVWVCE
jgi:2-polyprenyl-3-methyl-5-hydroxy-6-metoxy-1,4-benzoquinol methylase